MICVQLVPLNNFISFNLYTGCNAKKNKGNRNANEDTQPISLKKREDGTKPEPKLEFKFKQVPIPSELGCVRLTGVVIIFQSTTNQVKNGNILTPFARTSGPQSGDDANANSNGKNSSFVHQSESVQQRSGDNM